MKPNTKFIFTVMFQNYIIRKVFATGLRPVGTELGRKFQGKTEHLAASKHCTLQRSEGRSNKTIVFTTYKQRHCVGVSPKVLQINLNLLRKFPVECQHFKENTPIKLRGRRNYVGRVHCSIFRVGR
jgi:hypothetical protein